jgi:hypothetical protein
MGLDCKAISGEQAVVVLTPRSMADAPGQRLIDLICGGMAAIANQPNRRRDLSVYASRSQRIVG